MTQSDIAIVFGTRPEAIKLAPIVEAAKARGLTTRVLMTGQHATLCDPAVLAQLEPVEALGLASDGNMVKFICEAEHRVKQALRSAPPKCVLVQGDTASALAGSLAAHELQIPIAHVEAGVRSGSLSDPWPEEMIRIEIDRLATWRYAPTKHALRNLEREGLDGMVTGNTSMDTLRTTLTQHGHWGTRQRVVLVTLHRRELRERADALQVLQALCDACASYPSVSFVWPVHPGMMLLTSQLKPPANLTLRPPLDYVTTIRALHEVQGVLTDSGGLVEEACAIGTPTAILRYANDRPEAVLEGVARLFEPTKDGVAFAVASLVVRDVTYTQRPSVIYGNGHAAAHIVKHLAQVLQNA